MAVQFVITRYLQDIAGGLDVMSVGLKHSSHHQHASAHPSSRCVACCHECFVFDTQLVVHALIGSMYAIAYDHTSMYHPGT